MASVGVWLEVLSWTKALFEAITLGADLQRAYQQHRAEKDTVAEAQRVSQAYSTYSEAEVEAILTRLQSCRDRFISEGSGTARRQCLCSVFNDVINGNGGKLPKIDDWGKIFSQLSCGNENAKNQPSLHRWEVGSKNLGPASTQNKSISE